MEKNTERKAINMLDLKILEFETKQNKYIFDGVTGTILAIDDLIIELQSI